MARRRGQRKGYLRAENGSWLLTYRKYVWDAEAQLRRIIAATQITHGRWDLVTSTRFAPALTGAEPISAFAVSHFMPRVDDDNVWAGADNVVRPKSMNRNSLKPH